MLGDPKVIYDQYSCSFVVVDLEVDKTGHTGRILVAQSFDSDPTNPDDPTHFNGRWSFREINAVVPIGNAYYYVDFPGLGVDKQAIYITGNMYSFVGKTFGGSRLWIIDKSGPLGTAAVNGPLDPSSLAGLKDGNVTQEAYSLQPAHIYGTTAPGLGTFLVSTGWVNPFNEVTPWRLAVANEADDLLSVIRVDNPLDNKPNFTNQFINVGHLFANHLDVRNGPQSGINTTVYTGDGGALSAVWRNNSLWVSSTIDPLDASDQPVGRATAHWYKINTSDLNALTLAGQGNVSGADLCDTPTATYYPSIMVDSAGDMGIGFAASAPDEEGVPLKRGLHPGAYYTGRRPGDPAGTVRATKDLQKGADVYRLIVGGRNSWGDYSGIALDPAATSDMWVFNEYAMARVADPNHPNTLISQWGTMWRSLSFANPGGTPGLIAGALFNDPNDTGVRQPGDAPLAGWTVYLDANDNGALDPGEISTVTDADGNYTLSGLAAGSYTVRIVTPAGWAQTSSSAYDIQLLDDDSAPGRDFGAVQTGSLSGTVFNDANHNGAQDAGESGMSGVTVYLDDDNNGVLDPGEISTVTDANGNYTFGNLIPGDYVVREVVPAGYRATAPLGYAATVTVSSAQVSAGPLFGDVAVSTVPMDFAYLVTLARNYGQQGTFATGDLSGDGNVDFADLVLLARSYGSTLAAGEGSAFLSATPVFSADIVRASRRRHRPPAADDITMVPRMPLHASARVGVVAVQ